MNELISFLEKKIASQSHINLKDINCIESNQLSMEQMLNLIVPDDELNNVILKTYNETKDNYKFFVYCCQYGKEYNVFINILDNKKIYSNILRRNFKTKKIAFDYFNELSNIIKDNDLKTLSKMLMKRLYN